MSAARFVLIGMEELVSECQAFEGNAAAPDLCGLSAIALRAIALAILIPALSARLAAHIRRIART